MGSPGGARVAVPAMGPLVMGIINVTPDSFSDGGRLPTVDSAVAYGVSLAQAGADVLDVGGESTRPGAAPVSVGEEIDRVAAVIAGLVRRVSVPISVDTTKAAVARAAVAEGATWVNDVSGGLFDPDMAPAVDALPVTYIAGHLRGASLAEVHGRASPGALDWETVVEELAARLSAFSLHSRPRLWVDPGLGFGKADVATNLHLLQHAGDIGRSLRCRVVVGPSRKRFVRALVEADGGQADEAALDAGTVGACLRAAAAGAHMLRVHNVALLRAALAVYMQPAQCDP